MNEFSISCPNCGFPRKLQTKASFNSLIGQPQHCLSCKFRFKATEARVLSAQGSRPSSQPAQSQPVAKTEHPEQAEAANLRALWYS